MGVYLQTLYYVVFIIMVIAAVGNAMVIIVIYKDKRMHTSTNTFLANLAIADLIISIIGGTKILYSLFGHMFNLALQRLILHIIPFVTHMVYHASVITIIALSVRRYYTICKSQTADHIWTKERSFCTCILAWVLAAVSSSPYLVYSISHRTAYDIYSAMVFFFLPLIALTVLYLIMRRQLQQAAAPRINMEAIRRRYQDVTMLATVVVIFFTFHLPFSQLLNIFRLDHFLILLVDKTSTDIKKYHFFWDVFSSLMFYLHSVMNPILYGFMSRRFRFGFRNVCRSIPNNFACVAQTDMEMD